MLDRRGFLGRLAGFAGLLAFPALASRGRPAVFPPPIEIESNPTIDLAGIAQGDHAAQAAQIWAREQAKLDAMMLDGQIASGLVTKVDLEAGVVYEEIKPLFPLRWIPVEMSFSAVV